MSQFFTATDQFAILPGIMLALFGCAALLFHRVRHAPLVFTLLGLGFESAALLRQWFYLSANGLPSLTAFGGTFAVDRFALFFNALFTVSTLLVAISSWRYLEIENEAHGEYFSLLLFAQCGMFLIAGGADLVTLFIGLELMALAFYVMVGFLRGSRRSNEAAMKYFLLGAFSSGLLAYGFSLLYGIAGATQINDIAAAVAARGARDPMVVLALITSLAGLFFKISAAPFHMWAPDAYEGAPSAVTAYLAVASKAASFALLMRILLTAFGSSRQTWEPILIGVAVLSMTIGNIAALAQTNVKRLLAYSGVAHAGYLLLGLVAGNETGIVGVGVYMLVYTVMTLGAFLVIVSLRRRDLVGEDLADFAGLFSRSPWSAVLMLLFLLSLTGLPPTAGFWGKYYIFLALIETGHVVLAGIAVLYVAVSLYYYFQIVRYMWTEPNLEPSSAIAGFGMKISLAATGILTLAIGVYPEPFLRWAKESLFAR